MRDGTGGGGQEEGDFEVGTVNGRGVSYREFEMFRRRITAAIGGMPIQFANTPGRGAPSEELYKFLFAMALLEDAEQAGCTASDIRVGTYLENGHPAISMNRAAGDPKALEGAVDSFCRQMQISRQELLRGIREWITIDSYLNADANLAAINNDTIYTYYAFNRTEIDVKRFRVLETEALKERAKQEITGKPAEELDQAVRAHIQLMEKDQRYREPSRWRFAYVLVPFVNVTALRQPTDAEIQEQYDRDKSFLYTDKTLDEVKDVIKADLLQQEIDRQTQRNLTIDVDPQLRSQGTALNQAELVKLTQLVKHGVVAGDTGEAALTPEELMAKLPEGSEASFRSFLERLDDGDDVYKTPILSDWRENYNLTTPPFKSDNGYFRLRLLEYAPSTPAVVETEDGAIKPNLREQALVDMVGERAEELVREEAASLEEKLRNLMAAKEAGMEAPDEDMAKGFDRQAVQTMTYTETIAGNYDMLRMVVGDVMGPLPIADGEEGLEFTVLVERRLPGREVFDAEPVDVRNQFRDLVNRAFGGGMTFTYTENGPAAVIQPSPSILGGLAERFNRREIGLNQQLLDSINGEG